MNILDRTGKILRKVPGETLRYVDLRSINLDNSNLQGADLRYANLSFSFLHYADLRSADLSFSNLRCSFLDNSDLRDANLQFATMHNAVVQNANLQRADLQFTKLRSVKFQNADLSYANLQNANLQHADLYYADLQHANLQNADVRYANLQDADLRYADLCYADLRYVYFSQTKLKGAILPYFNETPLVSDIHKKVYEAASQPGALNINIVSPTEGGHDWAGFVIALAGEGGKALEDVFGTNVAATLIYMKSDPELEQSPDWYASNEEALEDMRRLAA